MVFQSCLKDGQSLIEALSDFASLSFWELMGCQSWMNFEPLEKAGSFQHFQMAFMTIPIKNP